MNKTFAVVTGASQGLGKSFAEELAKENHNLILVSLSQEDLPNLCKELNRKYKVECHFFETDLSREENILEMTDWINSKFQIDILINNAGIGGSAYFEKVENEDLQKMIQLNVVATTLIIHELLPNLKAQKKAHILNISSLAGLSPIPYKTVYPASKAFIYSFSRGLHEELKNTSVSVSVVNPGPMKTNGDTTKRIKKQGVFTKIALRKPEEIARISIRQMKKGKSMIITNWLSWLVLKIVPTWISLPILGKKFKHEIKDS